MFKCSADCCDRSTDSMSQVHQCIERCHTPLAKAQGLVTSELEKFQVRGMTCVVFRSKNDHSHHGHINPKWATAPISVSISCRLQVHQ